MLHRFPKIILAGLIAWGTGAAPAQAASNGQASFTLSITGRVPVVCRATLAAATVNGEGGAVDLGDMQEFCNNARGYQVWIDCPPDMPAATLTVDGQDIALSPSGSTMISMSATPARRTKHLVLEPADGSQPLPATLSIRVVTL